MKYRFEIAAPYPKRRFAVYEKKESLFDKIRRVLGIKKKEGKKQQTAQGEIKSQK